VRGVHRADKIVTALAARARHEISFRGRHQFDDRSKGSDSLLIVLCGYKPDLWPYTLARLPGAVGDSVDVCLVSAGRRETALEDMAKRYGWSYLTTEANQMSRAQNLAVLAHLHAEWIYKIDEDIFIDRHFIPRLRSGFERVLADGEYQPGFCAPIINVNGFSYLTFLRLLGLEDDYVVRFGERRRGPRHVKAHYDGEAATWIWERSLPFGAVAARIAGGPFEYSVVPHRFNIGAILLRRAFWQEIDGFRAHAVAGRLGFDEEQLCKECLTRGQVMVVVHDVLAGHFSFWPQEEAMRGLLKRRAADFATEVAGPGGSGGRRSGGSVAGG